MKNSNELFSKLEETGWIPEIIKSYDSAAMFFPFLQDNEITEFQGIEIIHENNHIKLAHTINPGGGMKSMDFDWIWEHRKVINDWIRTVLKEYDEWLERHDR